MTKYETALVFEKEVLKDIPQILGRTLKSYTEDLLRIFDIKGKIEVEQSEASLNKKDDAIQFTVTLEVEQ